MANPTCQIGGDSTSKVVAAFVIKEVAEFAAYELVARTAQTKLMKKGSNVMLTLNDLKKAAVEKKGATETVKEVAAKTTAVVKNAAKAVTPVTQKKFESQMDRLLEIMNGTQAQVEQRLDAHEVRLLAIEEVLGIESPAQEDVVEEVNEEVVQPEAVEEPVAPAQPLPHDHSQPLPQQGRRQLRVQFDKAQ